MKQAVTEKMREGAEAYRQERAAMRQRRLVIGAWMLYRADEWNLVIQRGDDGEQFFYPDMASALKSLFRKMIEPTGKQTAPRTCPAHGQVRGGDYRGDWPGRRTVGVVRGGG